MALEKDIHPVNVFIVDKSNAQIRRLFGLGFGID